MRKIVSLLLTFMLVLGVAGMTAACGSDDKTEILESYNNITDFSNRQGFRNWYYYYGDVSEPTLMVFDKDNGRWNGRDWYSFIEIRQFHPGNNGETFVGFKAPQKGTLNVSGVFTRCPTDFNAQNADGVFVYAQYNSDEEYLFSKTIAKDSQEAHEMSFSKQVQAGDIIYFVLNANGNNSFDNTKFDITIKYE